MNTRMSYRRLVLTSLVALVMGCAALACAPPPDTTPPTITDFTISPRVGGFWSDGVVYYWIRGVATVSVTADAGAGDTVHDIGCTATAGAVTDGAYNPTTPAQVRSRTFTLDVTGLSHGTDFWVKVTATDSHNNTTNPEDHKLRNRVHAIDIQGQPPVTIGLAVEYPARSGAEVQPGADVCNAVQPRFRINIPWPRIDPAKDAVEFVMQEAPNPPYQPEQPWHPGQREQSEHGLGDYEQVFTPQGKTLLYTWDTGGMIWPHYHFTQYKHNGLWNERGTFKYHWWWEPAYQGNPITSRGISTEPAPNPPPGPWTVIEPLPVTARNVTITSATASGGVGGGDYWLFDPDAPNLPLVVTYETDKLLNETATTTLKVYSADRSDDTPLREITGSATTDAASQQIAWDGTVNGQLVPKGIYVFDLHVGAQGSPYQPESGLGDSDDHKSERTRIASAGATTVGWDENAGTTRVRFTYRLEDDDSQPAASGEIRVYRPDFSVHGTYPCNSLAPGQDHSADLGIAIDLLGTWRFVLCVIDNHETAHKGHRNRATLPRSASLTVQVDIRQGANTITDQTQDTIVGRNIALEGVVLPAGMTVTHQWTVAGKRIAYYAANQNSATVTPLSDLTSSSVSYYWLDGGEGREVVYAPIVNGHQFSVKTTFNVKTPSGQVYKATGTIGIDSPVQTLVEYGEPADIPGVRFDLVTFSEPAGFAGGATAWWQVINSTERWRYDCGGAWLAAGSLLCDLPFPYSTDAYSDDSPGQVFESTSYYYAIDDTFSTYLMYKPTGSAAIWVPVVKEEWGWHATTHHDILWWLDSSRKDEPSGSSWPDPPNGPATPVRSTGSGSGERPGERRLWLSAP
jgi:hypothetical protein